MLSLFYTVLSIALVATMVAESIQYLAPGQQVTAQTYTLSNNGYTALSNAFSAYKTANSAAPAVSTWQTSLTPKYTFMPHPPANLSWSYGTDGTGYWFCLSGTIDSHQYSGLTQLEQIYSTQQYFLGTACGATASAAAPSSFPASVYATYWVTPP